MSRRVASQKALRRERYQCIVRHARDLGEFSVGQLQSAVAEQRPQFITYALRQLERIGVVRRIEGPRADASWRWLHERDPWDEQQWLDSLFHGTQIANTPPGDRPRERMLQTGAGPMRTAELLAILIRSGIQGESAIQAGEKIANHFSDRLELLPRASRRELRAVSGAIRDTAWCQIMAGIELGRRIAAAEACMEPPTRINSTSDAIRYCESRFARLKSDGLREEFHIVCLDTKNQVIAAHRISEGTLDASLVSPREVFKAALSDATASILLVHNHPSGDATPSQQDREVTTRLERAGELLNIRVLDHIILGRLGSASLRECS